VPIDERLTGKSKEELTILIQEMLKREPDLDRLLDLNLETDIKTPIDLDGFRRQIDFILRNDFPDPYETAFELAEIADSSDRFAAAGNWTAAGSICHLVLSEIIPSYDQLYDEEGDIAIVLQKCVMDLGLCLIEGSPDPTTRQVWFNTLLDAEFKDIEMGGIDLAYPSIDILVEQATDEEWLWIEERIHEKIASINTTYSNWGQEVLVNILAQHLKKTGRESEIPDLIFEIGSVEQQAFHLIKQGRLDDAISIANKHFVDLPGLVLQFADALVKAGGIAEAAAYVKNQLATGYRSSYLTWLARWAENQKDLEAALQWRLTVFHKSPNLENFKKVRNIASNLNQWDKLRPGLIQNLETDQQWDLLIEISLAEGEVTQALEYLPRQRWPTHELQVARAAEITYPQAAIDIYFQRSERLISRRGRSNYREAAKMLKLVRELHDQLGNIAVWNQIISDLRQSHVRLPAFQDELNQAGL
jgi:tetratricopeptide (TPR) repeat protein